MLSVALLYVNRCTAIKFICIKSSRRVATQSQRGVRFLATMIVEVGCENGVVMLLKLLLVCDWEVFLQVDMGPHLGIRPWNVGACLVLTRILISACKYV